MPGSERQTSDSCRAGRAVGFLSGESASLWGRGVRTMADSLNVDPAGRQVGVMRNSQQLPGLAPVQSTYRFDATVEERCPGQASRGRDIGVLAIADRGYWQPYYFR